MTFNIKLGLQKGLDPIIDLVREMRPDVLALQEVGANWRQGPAGDTTRRIAQQTGLGHAVFIPTLHSGPTVRYGHALLSRWPLRNLERRSFSVQRDEPRAALVTEVVGAAGTVRVVATHLSHLDADRRIQGPELSEFVTDMKPEVDRTGESPLVLAGDLNEPRDRADPWMRELLDTFDEAGRLDPAPTFENPAPDSRIDYLLVTGGEWSHARVPERPDLSDHRPVVAELRR